MTFYGADTEQLRTMSEKMHAKIGRLTEIQNRVTQSAYTVAWTGPDADAFRETVFSGVGPSIDDTVWKLRGRADELIGHADEQDEASDPRNFWQKLNDWLKGPADLSKLARNIQRLIQDPGKMLKMFKRFPDLRQAFKDLKDLEQLFPNLADIERKAIRAEWVDELLGKGWEKLGNAIPSKISSIFGINIPGKEWAGKLLSGMDDITDATKPWVKFGSKTFGKLLPGLDIGLGIHQIADPESTGYDKVSGGLSVASGTLTLIAPLTGPAAPIVAGVGIGLGIVSAGMDISKMAYEKIPAVKTAVDTVGNVAKGVGNAIGDGLSAVGNAFGSLFG